MSTVDVVEIEDGTGYSNQVGDYAYTISMIEWHKVIWGCEKIGICALEETVQKEKNIHG